MWERWWSTNIEKQKVLLLFLYFGASEGVLSEVPEKGMEAGSPENHRLIKKFKKKM